MTSKLKSVLAQEYHDIDPDALIAALLRNLGINHRRVMKAEREIAAFRKRSNAAKLGWRRRRPGSGLENFFEIRETAPVCFVRSFKRKAKP